MICPSCGEVVLAGSTQCARCGKRWSDAGAATAPAAAPNPFADAQVYEAAIAYPPPRPAADDPALRLVVPIGQSPLAIASGYLGLLSLALCFLGPLAILLGVLALRQINRNPNVHGGYRAIIGIVLGTLSSLGLAAAIVSFVSSR